MRKQLLMTLCTILAACGDPVLVAEDALRIWVDEIEVAAEAKSRSDILDKVSENYADSRGNSRKDIGDKLLLYFLRRQTVTFVSTIDALKISGESAAKMSLTVAMAGSNTSAFGLEANAYRFELELEQVDARWMLIGARWSQLGGDLR